MAHIKALKQRWLQEYQEEQLKASSSTGLEGSTQNQGFNGHLTPPDQPQQGIGTTWDPANDRVQPQAIKHITTKKGSLPGQSGLPGRCELPLPKQVTPKAVNSVVGQILEVMVVQRREGN